MDVLTFLSKTVEALAWPVTALVALVMLRDPVIRLVLKTRKVKFKDFEAEFGEKLDEMKAAAAGVLQPGKAAALESTMASDSQRLTDMAGVAPNAAVREAWTRLATAARAALRANGITLDEDVPDPYRALGLALSRANLVDASRLQIFNDLRILRNKVAHARGYEVTPAQARSYVEHAMALAADLAPSTKAEGGS